MELASVQAEGSVDGVVQLGGERESKLRTCCRASAMRGVCGAEAASAAAPVPVAGSSGLTAGPVGGTTSASRDVHCSASARPLPGSCTGLCHFSLTATGRDPKAGYSFSWVPCTPLPSRFVLP